MTINWQKVNEVRDLFFSPESVLLRELHCLIEKTKDECSHYVDYGPSDTDNFLGYTSYDLKKYRKLLSSKIKKFLKTNRKRIIDLKLRQAVDKRIDEAKAFQGKTVYKIDPHARPGRNHHTGRHYY
jgi:hypothetical protein